jgi:hypothetical protein
VSNAPGWAYLIVSLLAYLDALVPIVPSETSVINAGVVASRGPHRGGFAELANGAGTIQPEVADAEPRGLGTRPNRPLWSSFGQVATTKRREAWRSASAQIRTVDTESNRWRWVAKLLA